MRSRQGVGLSLVELLVVLSALTILMALLLPVLNQARDKGRATVCLSNARELNLALHLYVDDYNALPGDGNYFEPTRAAWVYVPQEDVIFPKQGSLYVYTGHLGVYRCPSAAGLPLSAAMNHALGWAVLDRVTYPSETVLLVEESGRSGFPNDAAFYAEHLTQDFVTSRHQGGGMVAWCDGSVRRIDATKRWDVRQFDPWR